MASSSSAQKKSQVDCTHQEFKDFMDGVKQAVRQVVSTFAYMDTTPLSPAETAYVTRVRHWTFKHLRDIILERADAAQCAAYVGTPMTDIESPEAMEEEADEQAVEEAKEQEFVDTEALAAIELELPKDEAYEATEVAKTESDIECEAYDTALEVTMRYQAKMRGIHANAVLAPRSLKPSAKRLSAPAVIGLRPRAPSYPAPKWPASDPDEHGVLAVAPTTPPSAEVWEQETAPTTPPSADVWDEPVARRTR